ncbi:MAG: radical SAM protein [Planctomycetota bacterium]|nr:MAG: radical SAM protein [Planctomycetota bacterium]
MPYYELLGLETEIIDGKIRARVKGILGRALQPYITRLISKLNTLKVIATKDGGNVYNLYNPPQPTKVGLRALERKLKEAIYKNVFPATANLAITFRCGCDCGHCSAAPFYRPGKEELSTGEMKDVINQALDLGASLIIFTGGEPLARSDTVELIDYVDKDRGWPLMFTCGQALTDGNVERLAEAGLGSMYVSIDSLDPKEHDRIRKIDGLWQKAIDGAKRALKAGILVGLSTYATPERIESGGIVEYLKFAQDQGFVEVTIFDAIPAGRWIKRDDIIVPQHLKDKLIEQAREFSEANPMGIVCQALINSEKGVGCFGAFSEFYVSAYGDVTPCDFNPISFGNVKNLPIAQIWQNMLRHPDFCTRYKTCRMQDPAYRAKYIDPLEEPIELPIPIEAFS